MPQGQARFGSVILGISNANPGVVTVDNTPPLEVGEMVRIANAVDNQSGNLSFNGDYTITGITGNKVSLNIDTSDYNTYISGGFLTQLNQQFLFPHLVYKPYIWTNEARNDSGYIPVGDIISIGDFEIYEQ